VDTGALLCCEFPIGRLVVAVSGGADSVALLRLLIQSRHDTPLVVAHLNHQLRGDESDGDEAFVRDLHAQLVRDHSHLRIDIERVVLPPGENLEAAARRERYRFLTNVARRHGATCIVTGHTANDQAETVVHRLLRGAGLQGLRGIAPIRELEPGLSLVRPMLTVSRGDVLTYLQQIGQEYRVDSSNADRRLTRNRIRHDLLPLLDAASGGDVVAKLCAVADLADAAFAEVERCASELLRDAERPRAGSMWILDLKALAAAPRDRQREALRLLWRREAWPIDGMRFVDWDRLIDVAEGLVTAIDLPGGVHARRRGHVLQLTRRLRLKNPP